MPAGYKEIREIPKMFNSKYLANGIEFVQSTNWAYALKYDKESQEINFMTNVNDVHKTNWNLVSETGNFW